MAQKKSDERIGHDQLKHGLKHNPFAALRPRGDEYVEPTPVPPAPAPERGTAPESPGVGRKTAPQPSVPAHERVVVRRERKGHGGKAVTIAEGPVLDSHDLASLAREVARALGTGARVEDGALVVQGEQTERLIAWLSASGLGSVVRGN